jgi:hypothetical protein
MVSRSAGAGGSGGAPPGQRGRRRALDRREPDIDAAQLLGSPIDFTSATMAMIGSQQQQQPD